MVGEEIRDSLTRCNVDDDRLPEIQQFEPLAYSILNKAGGMDPFVERMGLLEL